MSVPDPDAATSGVAVHLETTRENASSLRIRKDTADQVRRIRESINDAAGGKVVSNEDVVRLALLTLGRLAEADEDEGPDLTEQEIDVMMPLMDHINEAADPDALGRNMDTPADDGGVDG